MQVFPHSSLTSINRKSIVAISCTFRKMGGKPRLFIILQRLSAISGQYFNLVKQLVHRPYRNKYVQTNGSLSCKIELSRKQVTTHLMEILTRSIVFPFCRILSGKSLMIFLRQSKAMKLHQSREHELTSSVTITAKS